MNEAAGHRLVRGWIVLEILAVLALLAMIAGCTGSTEPRQSEPAPEAAEPPANTLTDEETAAGWELLFDGESFAGWRGLGRDTIPAEHWIIEDGAIRKVASGNVPTAADGQPLQGGDIMTATPFASFEFAFEWRVAPGANSGIKFNVSEEMSRGAEPFYAALGFEYQILDDELHPDAANGPNRTAAALYDLVEPDADKPLRPVGEYNSARIVFTGQRGEHWLNGQLVAEYDLASDDFAARLAASKYAPIEGFADPRAGHIVLQDHGDDVWFRNLKIREAPTDADPTPES